VYLLRSALSLRRLALLAQGDRPQTVYMRIRRLQCALYISIWRPEHGEDKINTINHIDRGFRANGTSLIVAESERQIIRFGKSGMAIRGRIRGLGWRGDSRWASERWSMCQYIVCTVVGLMRYLRTAAMSFQLFLPASCEQPLGKVVSFSDLWRR